MTIMMVILLIIVPVMRPTLSNPPAALTQTHANSLMATEEKEKLSPVEIVKTESNYLRGEIDQELVDGNDHFGKDSVQPAEESRAVPAGRSRRARAGRTAGDKSDKSFIFMVRTKIPGGKLTSDQLLAELDLCDEVGNTTLRITSRQGLQLHGILKDDLKRTHPRGSTKFSSRRWRPAATSSAM